MEDAVTDLLAAHHLFRFQAVLHIDATGNSKRLDAYCPLERK